MELEQAMLKEAAETATGASRPVPSHLDMRRHAFAEASIGIVISALNDPHLSPLHNSGGQKDSELVGAIRETLLANVEELPGRHLDALKAHTLCSMEVWL
jgi:hypothetical protein